MLRYENLDRYTSNLPGLQTPPCALRKREHSQGLCMYCKKEHHAVKILSIIPFSVYINSDNFKNNATLFNKICENGINLSNATLFP